jgi:hypothetical protein
MSNTCTLRDGSGTCWTLKRHGIIRHSTEGNAVIFDAFRQRLNESRTLLNHAIKMGHNLCGTAILAQELEG